MATLASAILDARSLVGDGPTDNLVRDENLNNSDIGNVVDGANRIFSVTNFPVSPLVSGGGVQIVVADGGVLPVAQYTVNEPLGQITATAAPQLSFHASYYFYLMNDVSWTTFIKVGLERINVSTGVPASDIVNIPEGLLPAVYQYACATWAQRMSSQTGLWYNQRLQERDEQRDAISSKFMRLAKQMYDNADKSRDDFYKGSGRENRAAFMIVRHTPRTWTPSS